MEADELTLYLLMIIHDSYSLSCPDGWFSSEGIGCFHFAMETNPMTWFEAQIYCNNLNDGSFLAEITDNKTQKFLMNYAQNCKTYESWWFGATDFFNVSIFP